MTRSSPYFMHDQVRSRVRLIMHARHRPAALASPVWPLIAVVFALTFVNIMMAMPQP